MFYDIEACGKHNKWWRGGGPVSEILLKKIKIQKKVAGKNISWRNFLYTTVVYKHKTLTV